MGSGASSPGIPIIIYPIAFAVDLFLWLRYAGNSLDPNAPLSSSIEPFTPHILGVGTIGQFSTEAMFQIGFFLALLATILVLVATIVWRRNVHVAPR